MFKEFLIKNKRLIIEIILVLIIIICGYFLYQNSKAVPIATIKDTSVNSIADAQLKLGVFKNLEDAKEVSNLIQDRTKKPADKVFYTNTQQEADITANTLAKKDNADYMLKETSKEENKDNTEKITNKYYAITQEKNNSIGLGATVIDKQVYASVAIEHTINKKNNVSAEIILHSKDLKNIDGATALIKKKF